MGENKKPQAVWEPGTLDATRKNIGAIDAAEAARMTKILGGEIMTEKSVPIDYSKLPKKRTHDKVVRGSGIKTSNNSKSSSQGSSSGAAGKTSSSSGTSKKTERTGMLPPISPKDNQKIDKLMMSNMYAIKPNYGLFNFIKHFTKDGYERVIPEFIEVTLKAHIDHLESFISLIKALIQAAPDAYKSKIQTDMDVKFRFLRKVADEWSVRDIKLMHISLGSLHEPPVVENLIPFIKAMYRQLLTVFYLTEPVINKAIKEVYTDMLHFPSIDKGKVGNIAKNAVTEWVYIYTHMMRGLYPLLMRMCGTSFAEFPFFFTANATQILNFLGMTKFDLLLREKKSESSEDSNKAKSADADKAKKEEEEKKKQQETKDSAKYESVKKGLSLLDRLFPGAGFKNLETFPDLWPYFDPLYDFDECFLMLPPESPMQVTLVLCEILLDFFHACSKMKFNPDANTLLSSREDNITKALSEWAVYVDTLFEKECGELLKQFVNQTYSQPNYANMRPGKKILTDILWQIRYSFLPYFNFEQLLLERPLNNSKYIPLYTRTAFLNDVFSDLAEKISQSEGTKGVVGGLDNPWEHYSFELSSPISKRVDVFLNAKERGSKMTATNANLIKYISYIIAVLDWWINSKTSPAYKADTKKIYRTRPDTNEPIFSMESRTDQDKLFAENVRNAIQKKAAK